MPETTIENMNVHQRMLHAAALIDKRIPKLNKNEHQGYKFASHDDVVEFCRPFLIESGLLLTCSVETFEAEVVELGAKKTPTMIAKGVMLVNVINADKPEDKYTVCVPGVAYDTSDKAIGKLISYAKKYALTACCGLLVATGVDADEPKKVAKDSAQEERRREEHEAYKVIYTNLEKCRIELGWSKEQASKFAQDNIGVSVSKADSTKLQLLLDKMIDEKQKEPEHA